jgi:hypothetical protein
MDFSLLSRRKEFLMFRQLLLAKFLCVLLAVNGNGQVATPETPPVEDAALPALAVTITGPTAPVPIGTKQALTAMHEAVEMPGYF